LIWQDSRAVTGCGAGNLNISLKSAIPIMIIGQEMHDWPMRYMGFLEFEAHATFVLTDFGVVQEDTGILKVSCETLQENSELP